MQVDHAADQAAGQDAEELRDHLRPGRRPDRVADLEVVEQIGALPGGAAGDVGADQVGGGLAGRGDAGSRAATPCRSRRSAGCRSHRRRVMRPSPAGRRSAPPVSRSTQWMSKIATCAMTTSALAIVSPIDAGDAIAIVCRDRRWWAAEASPRPAPAARIASTPSRPSAPRPATAATRSLARTSSRSGHLLRGR